MNPGIIRTWFAQNVLPALASLACHTAFAVVALSSAGIAFHPPPADTGAQTILDAGVDAPLLGTAGSGDIAGLDVPTSDVPGGAAGVPALRWERPNDAGGTDAVPLVGLAALGAAERGDVPGRPAASPRGGGSMFDVPGSADARSVCYVSDASGSMLNKMATLKYELQRAVSALTPAQRVNLVYAEGAGAYAVDPQALLPATDANKKKAEAFLDDWSTGGTPDVLFALRLAFQLHPEVIYLITDGDYPDNRAVLAEIARLNAGGRVRVNTIAFVNRSDTDTEFLDLLAKIAARNGGTFRKVNEEDLYP